MSQRSRPWRKHQSSGFSDKSKKTNPVYRQNRWTKASRTSRIKNPVCSVEGCKIICLNGAGVTDHIIPESRGGAFWDKRNWQTLCHSHHNSKSRKEQQRGILYESEANEKGRLIPTRDTEGNLIPIDGGGIKNQMSDEI